MEITDLWRLVKTSYRFLKIYGSFSKIQLYFGDRLAMQLTRSYVATAQQLAACKNIFF